MCGIVGFTHQNRSVDRRLIEGATSCLIHRGPDQQGVYESGDISLGAVRLTIIDLISGEQPMHSEDGDTTLVYNGEVYNHRELRAELESLGHRFATNSDTEVVLHAFLEWDIECFPRLRGMFALAIWRESQKRLVLARDRVGIKPLYFSRKGQDVYFSSELKGILHHPDIERRLSLEGLNCYLRVNYVPSPFTLIEGVEKLPPGHTLTWQRGRTTIESYWRCPDATAPRKPWTLEAAKEQLDFLLKESVKEHLVADVPVGIWASGGLDSSTILHYATQASSQRLKTFSITFKGRSFDEAAYINEVAEYYGTDHSETDLSTDSELQEAIRELAYYSDEPGADAGCLPVWFLAKMSSQQVTVALSGEGADELFGGYLTYLASYYAQWARRVPASVRRAAIRGLGYWPVSDEKISFEYKLKRFLRGSLLPPDESHIFWNGTFSEADKRAFLIPADPAPMARILRNMPGGSGIESLHEVRSAILFARRHSLQSRPHEHGALVGSAAAVSGSSHRRVCRLVAAGLQASWIAVEIRAQRTDEGKVAAGNSSPEKSRLRHSRPRLVSRRAEAASAGHGDRAGSEGHRHLPLGRHPVHHQPAYGTARQPGISLVGLADSVLMDQTVEHSNRGGARARSSTRQPVGDTLILGGGIVIVPPQPHLTVARVSAS